MKERKQRLRRNSWLSSGTPSFTRTRNRIVHRPGGALMASIPSRTALINSTLISIISIGNSANGMSGGRRSGEPYRSARLPSPPDESLPKNPIKVLPEMVQEQHGPTAGNEMKEIKEMTRECLCEIWPFCPKVASQYEHKKKTRRARGSESLRT